MRILVVEDQLDVAALITDSVNRAGFDVDRVGRLVEVKPALLSHDYPLMLLDRRLPDGDGLRALSEFRRARPGIRVIIVSALNGTGDKVDGLESGADDYLAKPFDADELLARIRACLRRASDVELPRVVMGRLSFDFAAHQAFVSDRPFELHRKEALLLESLMRRAERFVNHRTIMKEINSPGESASIDALRMLALRLRQKLKSERLDVELASSRGVGYMLRRART
ncbi:MULTISPECIES: response regulator transcription factor [Methylosinus]|uniref:DNA-binding response regulator n=1 Tax=Methylosinus trichosporium (strain ATCC 35070 / NCIMB 11131 / UNIQEM 75 / OB3b) TaxID=595536 RepID=A0A2D2D5K1_METT3|nr:MULTISPECIES: response regulator transcription factor [Methylosinus]ATQ70290.1 DNA-binding response regulator [Methylosinus trichosporium OB3b]OBS51280.1 two-component system response regulator [Methylosinus sp. 3S-1]